MLALNDEVLHKSELNDVLVKIGVHDRPKRRQDLLSLRGQTISRGGVRTTTLPSRKDTVEKEDEVLERLTLLEPPHLECIPDEVDTRLKAEFICHP